ncbi:MAG: hypothetical protein KA717_22950 [Woronichinia naegeliana WA131]|uniref:7-carboxy-7-deazaguanine synthase n=1 Tax=Woronichinia naegeliana WA131 TaxID=2824559 RepID=A0A977KTV1_9CYAN|nr:MAG: hypothetical protein KA717_22950 [Woronichinia naegeliana WA131]
MPKLSIYEKVNELKVVISNTADFSWAEQQALCIPSTALQYLQPEWNCPESQALIVNYILQHPQWRLSLQSHKYLGLAEKVKKRKKCGLGKYGLKKHR